VVSHNIGYTPVPVYMSSVPITPEVVIVPPDRMPLPTAEAAPTISTAPVVMAPTKPEEPAETVADKAEAPTQTVSAKPAEELKIFGDTSSNVEPEKHDATVPRRSFADITAKPGYAHAPDYSWIAGELQYIHAKNVWRVRYASVDEEDRYGGGVTLLSTGPMTDYKDGQIVRVVGQVAQETSHECSYRVNSIQVLADR
jgi:hypothetical protein